MTTPVPFWLVFFGTALSGRPQAPVDFDAQIQKDFEKRVEEYMKLRKTAHEGLHKLKPTESPKRIEYHEKGLAHRIRELRRGARQGDIFTAEISTQFRKLIGSAMQGPEAERIRLSLRRAEPVHLKTLRANQRYPEGIPLQSTPPSLLLNLPKLPPEVEYRVVGRALILRDAGADLIVDFIPDAIPAETHAP